MSKMHAKNYFAKPKAINFLLLYLSRRPDMEQTKLEWHTPQNTVVNCLIAVIVTSNRFVLSFLETSNSASKRNDKGMRYSWLISQTC